MDQAEFEELTEENQRSAIEIGVAMTILATRIPVMSQDLVELITDLFSDSAKLSRNKVSYILEEVGRSLYQHDWRFEIKKTGKDIITTFDEDEHNKNGDGEHKLLPESPSLN